MKDQPELYGSHGLSTKRPKVFLSQHFRRDKDDATGRCCRNRFVQRLQQQGNTLAEGRQHVGSAFARRLANLCYCRVRDVEDGAATLPKNHQPHFGFSVERARDVRKLYFDLHDPSSE